MAAQKAAAQKAAHMAAQKAIEEAETEVETEAEGEANGAADGVDEDPIDVLPDYDAEVADVDVDGTVAPAVSPPVDSGRHQSAGESQPSGEGCKKKFRKKNSKKKIREKKSRFLCVSFERNIKKKKKRKKKNPPPRTLSLDGPKHGNAVSAE